MPDKVQTKPKNRKSTKTRVKSKHANPKLNAYDQHKICNKTEQHKLFSFIPRGYPLSDGGVHLPMRDRENHDININELLVNKKKKSNLITKNRSWSKFYV